MEVHFHRINLSFLNQYFSNRLFERSIEEIFYKEFCTLFNYKKQREWGSNP